MSKAKIIGIGGVSRSGKSSLAKTLSELLPKKVLILCQDDFVKPEIEIPMIRDRVDWEHPESIDVRRLIGSLKSASTEFDFVIVEGLMAFHPESLVKLYDLKILMEISKRTFLNRRRVETRWGNEPDWFIEHVWESFEKFGNYDNPDIRISGEQLIQPNYLSELVSTITNHK